MSSWQGMELDSNLRQLAERAAGRAGITVEQWLERAIRRAYPAAFQVTAPPAPAPAPAAPPRASFGQAQFGQDQFGPAPQYGNGFGHPPQVPQPQQPPQPNGIDQSLAELIAVARAPRPSAAARQPLASPPAPEAAEPNGSILDQMSRRRRPAAGAAPAQNWPADLAPEPAPEHYADPYEEQHRRKPRRPAAPVPASLDPDPVYQDEREPEFAPRHGNRAQASWPSFQNRAAPVEEDEEDYADPLELTRPLIAKSSRKPKLVAVAVTIALALSLGALAAQRFAAMTANLPGPQDQAALNDNSGSVSPPPAPMLAPQQDQFSNAPSNQSPAVSLTPPSDQNAGPSSSDASAANPQSSAYGGPNSVMPPMTSFTAPTVTQPDVNTAMPPPVAYSQPATTPPLPPSSASGAASQTNSAPTPPTVSPATVTPAHKVAMLKPPAPAPAKKLGAGSNGPGLDNAPQDPAKLAAWLQDRVKTNDPVAEYRLGVLYALGQGVKQDYGQAAQLFQAAADGGVAEAQYNVAVMYSEGMGVQRDPAQAVKWYQKAAAQGNPNAAFNLGVAYSNGAGVTQDIQEAARWFGRAASAGVVNAQFNLGLLYERGEGVPQSPVEAYAWYAAAASRGDQGAAERRDRLASGFTPDDLKKAQDRAVVLQKTIQTGASPATIDQKAAVAKP
jgi:hypothetical protein